MMPLKDAELGFSLFVTVHNVGETSIQLMTRPVQCCEVITPSVTDCKSIKLMGGFMGTMKPGAYLNASWTYPTLYEYNRRGECVLDLWWRDSLNRTDTNRFTIPFDTYVVHEIPWYMRFDYRKADMLLNKKCDSPDLDVIENCAPVDCHAKYDGNKNYFSWADMLCVPSPTCYSDPNKDLPDVAYSPNCNLCTDLEFPIGDEDMAILLRPMVNLDVFESMSQRKVSISHCLRCHHGTMDERGLWCSCEPGWSSAQVPEDFSAQRTLFTHMCTIYSVNTFYDVAYQFVVLTKQLWVNESFYLAEIAFFIALAILLLSCWLELCFLKPPIDQPSKSKEICEDSKSQEEDVHFESDGTEIVCSSSDNWSDDLSDFEFSESSLEEGEDSMSGESKRVTWMEQTNWQLGPSGNIEVLYPAKHTINKPSSLFIPKISSKASVNSCSEKQKIFETHFRLLVSLLLQRQPNTDAREHIDWIFKNCPTYQKRLVIRFMKSFGMDVDRQGNLIGFTPRGNITRSGSGFKKNKKKKTCHLRPKKKHKVYQCRQEKRWSRRSSLIALRPHRGDPEGVSDTERNLTISPDYRDILRSVLSKCLRTSASDLIIHQTETQKDGLPEEKRPPLEEEQPKIPECSSHIDALPDLDISSRQASSILQKANAMQCMTLRPKKPSMTIDLPGYAKHLKHIRNMKRSYWQFLEEIPRSVSRYSSHESNICSRMTALDHIHHKITEQVMRKLASLEERYRGILSNESKWEVRGLVTQNITGLVQNFSGHIPLNEEKTFLKFFMNLVHFLFLMSCKRETMSKIMRTFGCRRHRREMRLHPHACLFLCYLQPILFKFWRIVEVERLLLEYFVIEYPQHTCLSFITNLKKTTKFRICLYLHIYKILAMIINMEGMKEPYRKKFLLHINILERNLARFLKDMEKFQNKQSGVKPSYILAGGLLSILEVLHYFMVQSLYKMCLLHADENVP